MEDEWQIVVYREYVGALVEWVVYFDERYESQWNIWALCRVHLLCSSDASVICHDCLIIYRLT